MSERLKERWESYLLASRGQAPDPYGNLPPEQRLSQTAYLHQRLLIAALAFCQALEEELPEDGFIMLNDALE